MKISPPVIGHRFAAAIAPENTVSGCQLAASLGLKWVEFDVMLSACGTPVVFHDHTLRRTTNGRGRMRHQSLPALKSLDAGSWFDEAFKGEQIPTLQEILLCCDKHNMAFNLEIKPNRGQAVETAEKAWQMVAAYWPKIRQHHSFQVFSDIALETIRSKSEGAQLGYLVDVWRDRSIQRAKQLKCVSIHVREGTFHSGASCFFNSAAPSGVGVYSQ